jgi:hypothetical protein
MRKNEIVPNPAQIFPKLVPENPARGAKKKNKKSCHLEFEIFLKSL